MSISTAIELVSNALGQIDGLTVIGYQPPDDEINVFPAANVMFGGRTGRLSMGAGTYDVTVVVRLYALHTAESDSWERLVRMIEVDGASSVQAAIEDSPQLRGGVYSARVESVSGVQPVAESSVMFVDFALRVSVSGAA